MTLEVYMAKHGKDPAFLMYSGDWMSDSFVRLLSPSHRGIYIDLLCIQHMDGAVPLESSARAVLLRVSAEEEASAWAVLLTKFPGGVNPRLKSVIDARSAISSVRSAASHKSHEPKAEAKRQQTRSKAQQVAACTSQPSVSVSVSSSVSGTKNLPEKAPGTSPGGGPDSPQTPGELIAWFEVSFAKTQGEAYAVEGAKDTKSAKWLLQESRLGVEEVLKRLWRGLTTHDDFIDKSGRSLSKLTAAINRPSLIAVRSEGAKTVAQEITIQKSADAKAISEWMGLKREADKGRKPRPPPEDPGVAEALEHVGGWRALGIASVESDKGQSYADLRRSYIKIRVASILGAEAPLQTTGTHSPSEKKNP